MRRTPWRIVAPGFGVLVVALLPLIAGTRTLYLRDLLNYHYAVKLSQARAMADGFLPLIDPLRAGGQPLVGNLNNVALYPDNLLYLVASPLWALNAHMWLHLLLAPLSFYWMARAWGLTREAAWAGGFIYATSGFFLSLLNLYNMVAGAALAPAFVAACLMFAQGRRRGFSLMAVGALWCLTLLAGEPLIAGLVLLAGLSAVLARGAVRAPQIALLGAALLCGTILAAPQLIELARILPSSYRVAVGYSHESRLVGSWNPRMVMEWLIPLAFGEPGFRYWGQQLDRGGPPLLYSLYPGLLGLGLVLSSRRPRSRLEIWSWSAIGVGVFVALGRSNPVIFKLLELPQTSFLRYPVKWFLLVAIAGSLLAALSYERSEGEDGRRRLGLAFVALGGVLFAIWCVLWLSPDGVAARLDGVLAPDFAAAEVLRWRGLALVSLAVVAGYLALLAGMRRSRWAAPAALIVHVLSQLWLLGSLASSDEAAAYRDTPSVLEFVEPGEIVVQACVLDFGCGETLTSSFPDDRLLWLQRRGWSELYPFAGVGSGVPYAFNTSPDGLDSFLTVATGAALPGLSDADLLRVLETASVDVLLIGRPLAEEVAERVRLRGVQETVGGRLWAYGLVESASDVRFVARVRTGETREVMRALLAEDFDPSREVFLPGRATGLVEGRDGTARESASGFEDWTYEVQSPDGGLLVVARSHLPIYRATVDGDASQVLVVNSGQLAVEVPAGSHVVDLWVDRAPFRRSLVAALAGLIGLIGLGRFAARASQGGPALPGVRESAP